MALENDVLQALVQAGNQLKHDLWQPADVDILKQRAKDLTGLEIKAATTTDADKREQYKLAASLVVDHVKMIAIARMLIAQKDVMEAMERLFLKVLLGLLAALLPHVI